MFCLVIVIVISSFASCSADKDKTTKNDSVIVSENTEAVETEPMTITTDEIIDSFQYDAQKAVTKYENSYVKLTGKLQNIDIEAGSFSLVLMNKEGGNWKTIECIYDKDKLDTVMDFTVGQEVTVTGTITSSKV